MNANAPYSRKQQCVGHCLKQVVNYDRFLKTDRCKCASVFLTKSIRAKSVFIGTVTRTRTHVHTNAHYVTHGCARHALAQTETYIRKLTHTCKKKCMRAHARACACVHTYTHTSYRSTIQNIKCTKTLPILHTKYIIHFLKGLLL